MMTTVNCRSLCPALSITAPGIMMAVSATATRTWTGRSAIALKMSVVELIFSFE